MKLIIRSVIAVLFLAALTLPALAQSPKLAIKIGAPSGKCFPLTLKNLQTTVLTTNSAYLVVFDQGKCQRVCESKIALKKDLKPCEPYTYRICCSGSVPPKFVAYVKVFYGGGYNESFLVN
ncbi:MAG: hypothetical protein ABR611_13715 [Chthoniobacterales bacterium]